MSVKVGELYGELRLDKKPFDSGLDAAENKSKGWASRVAGVLGKSAGALLKWGAVGATVAGGGAFALGNMASDLNETISKTKVVFGENSKAVLAWGKDAATSLGLSRNEALGARATLGNLFVSMGVGSKQTKDMSGSMVELAGDLASFNNEDPTEVLEKLRSGLVGEAEPLRSLGVNISAAATEQEAMRLGLKKVNGEFSASAKAQANYSLIMKQTKTAQGDFKRTSAGMANQQRITAATFKDTLADIGQAFTPIFESILPQVTAGLQTVGEWVTANMPMIKEVITNAFTTAGVVIGFLFTEIIPRLIAAFTTLVTIITGVVGFISDNFLPIIATLSTLLIGFIISVLPLLAAKAAAWWAIAAGVIAANLPLIAIAAAIGIVIKVLDHFGLLRPLISAVFGAIQFGAGIAGKAVEVVGGIIGTVARKIGDAWNGLTGVTRKVWDGLGGIIKGALNVVIGLINGFIRFINGIQIHIPEIGVGPVHSPAFDWNGMNLGTIPALASGVRGFAGGLAMVGERGPEIVNLPQGSNVHSAAESAGMMGGSRRPQVIQLVVDGRVLAEVVERQRYMRGGSTSHLPRR